MILAEVFFMLHCQEYHQDSLNPMDDVGEERDLQILFNLLALNLRDTRNFLHPGKWRCM